MDIKDYALKLLWHRPQAGSDGGWDVQVEGDIAEHDLDMQECH